VLGYSRAASTLESRSGGGGVGSDSDSAGVPTGLGATHPGGRAHPLLRQRIPHILLRSRTGRRARCRTRERASSRTLNLCQPSDKGSLPQPPGHRALSTWGSAVVDDGVDSQPSGTISRHKVAHKARSGPFGAIGSPPPMMLAAETEWCGSLYGGLVINSSGGVPSVGSIKIVGRRCWPACASSPAS
jgi:hypothetical protein